ncbi:MAG: DUF4179 domain-containing protein [Dysosmobacter sp.]
MEQLGTPLGVSCTQDGLTITADAILADEYTYAILYSIQREDGTSLRADGRSESVSFQEYTMQWPQQAQRTSSTLRPYDEDTSDQTVQYLEICQMNQPLQAGRMTAVFRAAMIDEVQADGTIRTVPLGDGPWELRFDFTPKASSIDLPTGQQFQVDGLDCTLTRVSLSPSPSMWSTPWTPPRSRMRTPSAGSACLPDQNGWYGILRAERRRQWPAFVFGWRSDAGPKRPCVLRNHSHGQRQKHLHRGSDGGDAPIVITTG